MLNDATGLKKIYLAAGYTDLQGEEWMVSQRSSGSGFSSIRMIKIRSFFSAGRRRTGSRDSYGKGMGSCFFTRD